MMSRFLERTKGYRKTSSVEFLEDKSVVFVRSKKYLAILYARSKGLLLHTLMPYYLQDEMRKYSNEFVKRVNPFWVHDVDRVFVLYHNWVNRDKAPKKNEISKGVMFHSNVLLADWAMKYIYSPGMHKPY